MDYLKKELEELLSESSPLSALLQGNAPNGLLYWDLEHFQNKWNHSNFWKTLGHKDLHDGHWHDHLHPEDLCALKEKVDALLQGDQFSLEHEGRYHHKNGKTVWLRISGNLHKTKENGAPRLFGTYCDISTQKESKQELEATHRRYGHLLEGTHIGTWEWNVQTGQMIYNERWANILGYTLAELRPITEKTLIKYTHPEDLEQSNKLLQDHLENKTPIYRCETRMRHKNGQWIWIMDQGKVVSRTQTGAPEWVTGLHEEITERKQNELLLLGYKNLLERTNDAAKISVWELDLETKRIHCSNALQKLADIPHGYQPTLKEAIGFFKKGKNRKIITKAIGNALTKGIGFDHELEVITKGNVSLWSRNVGISESKDGKCTRLYGFFQDIDEKARANRELMFKEEQFRKTFEYASVGMALVGLEGQWLRANSSLCEILGYTETELRASTFQEITHPEDLEADLGLVGETLEGLRESYQLEKRYFHKNGKVVWALLSVSMVRSSQGKPLHFVSQIMDITKRKMAERKVSDLLEVTRERNARLENFAHIVSHNLRSHSSNLLMLLDLIKTQHPEATENDYFPLLTTAVINLEDTIGHLNEIAVINGGTKEKLSPLNLDQYVKKALEGIREVLMGQQGSVINNTGKDLEILAVPEYLESILWNVLSNAVKYAAPQRAPLITVTSGTTDGHTFLSIQDNGLGIDLNFHGDKIFGMFKTFHYHADARGIGLFMTKNQIESMGGKIQVESEVNKGTTFTLFFKNAKN